MTARPVVVGTSGHIDHGKTALIRRLTGTDTDRLPEEKARGITIELGFARMLLPSGRPVSFVDVPGHERFVKTMLAGAGGIEAALLVIACDEGVMPQTREHLDIMHFLGVSRGVIALTKSDLVEEEMIGLVEEEARELVASTTLAAAPIVACSASTGRGTDELLGVLDDVLAQAAPAPAGVLARLAVDRVFTRPGFGTVVTGTLRGGAVEAGERLELLPSGREVRVRRAQVHGADVDRAEPGQRTALALHGVDLSEVSRGDVLATPKAILSSHMIDARLNTSARMPRRLVNRARIRYHQGTREILGRIVLLDVEEMGPNESALAQIRLEEPEVCLAGDRFVIRSYSPQVVIAGGVVLDAVAPKRHRFRQRDIEALQVKEKGEPTDVLLDALTRSGRHGLKRAELAGATSLTTELAERALEQLLGERRARLVGAERVVTSFALDDLCRRIVSLLAEFHRASPLRYGAPKEELKAKASRGAPGEIAEHALGVLRDRGEILLIRDKVRLASEGESLSEAQHRAAEKIEAILRRERFAPPSVQGLESESGIPKGDLHDIIETLVELGRLIKITPDLAFHRDQLDEAVEQVREVIGAREQLGVADLKERLGVSRKYTVPLLEYLDRIGVTRRQGDVRVAGPKLKDKSGGSLD